MDRTDRRYTSERLRKYLDSGGTQLHDIKVGSAESEGEACIFCSDGLTPECRPVYRYVYPKTFKGRKCYNYMACEHCSEIVIEFEADFKDPENSPRKEHHQDILNKKMVIEELFSSSKEERIKDFAEEGILASDHPLFYIHKKDAKGFESTGGKCYFCREEYTKAIESGSSLNMAFEIEVPVKGKEDYLTGGILKVCSHCYSQVMNEARRLGHPESLHLLQNALHNPRRPPVTSDQCVECGKRYTIDEDEAYIRTQNEAFGKHMCPSCTFRRITNAKPLNMYFHGGELRYVDFSCSVCESTFSIDRTWEMIPTLSQYSVGLNKMACQRCVNYGPHYMKAIVGKTLIVLYKRDIDRYLLRAAHLNGKTIDEEMIVTTSPNDLMIKVIINFERTYANEEFF